MEQHKKSKPFRFSVFFHNCIQIFKRLFWVPILLAAALGLWRWRNLTASYVPLYQASSVYRVTSSRSGNMDISTYGVYLNTSAAENLARSFPYVMNSDKARSLLKEQTGSSYLPAPVTCRTETTLLIFESTGMSGEAVYQALQSAVSILPEAAKDIVQSFTLEPFEEAVKPSVPFNKPNVQSSTTKYALLGLGLGFALIFVLAYFRRTVHNTEDLHELLSTPCLGLLPKVRFKARTKQDRSVLLTNPQLEESYLESMRGICFQLQKELETQPAKVLMVTSTSPNEGKSTVSANLALMLASLGHRTVLVDCDLRKQDIKDIFKIEKASNGVVDLIQNRQNVEDELLSVEGSPVRLLSGDRVSEHPQNFLSSPELQNVLKPLRSDYEYIVVDTPPSGLLSDAATLSEWVDGVLYVVRQDYLGSFSILDSVQRLSELGVRFVGSIINYAERSTSQSGYGYGSKYSYGYGYGYGYGNKYYGARKDEEALSESENN